MAYRRLNREGFESARNMSKPFRHPRLVTNNQGDQVFHDMDMMRLSATGKAVNSTGCFGVVSSSGIGRISIVVRRGAPGKERGPRKRKRTSKLYCGDIHFDFTKASYEQLYNLRANILTARLLGMHSGKDIIPSGLKLILEQITAYIIDNFSADQVREMFRADAARKMSTKGMVEKGGIQVEKIKSIGQRVKRALFVMRVTNDHARNSYRANS